MWCNQTIRIFVYKPSGANLTVKGKNIGIWSKPNGEGEKHRNLENGRSEMKGRPVISDRGRHPTSSCSHLNRILQSCVLN